MLSLRSTSTSAAALDRADPSARAAARAGSTAGDRTGGVAADAASADPANGLDKNSSDATGGLSTVTSFSLSGGTIPAALCRMGDIAVASAAGTLDEAERARLRTEYMSLSQQVSSVVGSESAERAKQLAVDRQDARSNDSARDGQRDPAANAPSRTDTSSSSSSGTDTATPRDHAAHAATTTAAAAASPAAHPRTEAAHPAALAQFRAQPNVPNARFHVRA
jgi:hypothetical protein